MNTELAPSLETLATRANAAHREAERLAVSALEHARAAGEALLAAKEQLPHGAWGGWLQDNFEGSPRTAQMYMRVARSWGELDSNPQRAADLSLRQAAKLLARPFEDDPYGIQAMEEVNALLASFDLGMDEIEFTDPAAGARYWSECASIATRIGNTATLIKICNLKRMAEAVDVGRAPGVIAP